MASATQPFYTVAQYLARERAAEARSEYLDGRIYAMAGASRAHNLIVPNVAAELAGRLRGRPCEVYASNMWVKVSPTGLYTYPDVVVACPEPRFACDLALRDIYEKVTFPEPGPMRPGSPGVR